MKSLAEELNRINADALTGNFEQSDRLFKSYISGVPFEIQLADGELELVYGDLIVDLIAPEGTASGSDGGTVVAFDTELTRELVLEGLARDLVRGIQEGRKAAGFEVSDRIHLGLELSGDALEAAQTWQEFIAGEVLAAEVSYGPAEGHGAEVEGGTAWLKRV